MEPSKVWKNLLTGKQAVPTVACPSCGGHVPEFRIHSHLDTCLTALPSGIPDEEGAAQLGNLSGEVHELSDGRGEEVHPCKGQVVAGRGQGRGRGRGRKRREVVEKKWRNGENSGGRSDAGRKRKGSDNLNVGGGKASDAPALVDDDEDDDVDDYSFYQNWEYSVSRLDELGRLNRESPLSDLQRNELRMFGVLAIERREMSAMILQLDHLLADFQPLDGSLADDISLISLKIEAGVRTGNLPSMPALKQHSVPQQISSPADRANPSEPGQDEALEAWWQEWDTGEWPEGPLPPGFHAGLSALPPHLKIQLPGDQDLHIGTDIAEIGNYASGEATAVDAASSKLLRNLKFNESGGIIGDDAWNGCSDVQFMKSPRKDVPEVGMQSRSKVCAADKIDSSVMAAEVPHEGAFSGANPSSVNATVLSSRSKPTDVDPVIVAETSTARVRSSSPSRALPSSSVAMNEASPGIQACPICSTSFPPNSSNKTINEHIDECLTQVAELLD